jgi:hypothetical protein
MMISAGPPAFLALPPPTSEEKVLILPTSPSPTLLSLLFNRQFSPLTHHQSHIQSHKSCQPKHSLSTTTSGPPTDQSPGEHPSIRADNPSLESGFPSHWRIPRFSGQEIPYNRSSFPFVDPPSRPPGPLPFSQPNHPPVFLPQMESFRLNRP